MAIAMICFSLPAHVRAAGDSMPGSQLVERLEKIAASMQRVRFCFNENCFYRNVETKIEPPDKPNGKYTATISAIIDRPAAVLDTGDYHFVFNENRWQLVKGEEYTDVADYVFDLDRYEIYSVHTNRKFQGDIAQAKTDGNLKSGYLPLYFEILDNGLERI
jgi:hypothetical protein